MPSESEFTHLGVKCANHLPSNQLDCEVEETWLRKTLLCSMHPESCQYEPCVIARSLIPNTISQQDMNYQGSACICRVPKAQVKQGTIVECVHCGMSELANYIRRSHALSER